MSRLSHAERIRALPCWSGDVEIAPLQGGMTNLNFRVSDRLGEYVVRMGDDVPEHLVWREHEGLTSEVAAQCGFSPRVVHREAGILVIDFIAGKVFDMDDVKSAVNLERIVDMLSRFHRQMQQSFNGYPILFWVFQVLRHYKNILEKGQNAHLDRVADLMRMARQLEGDVGPVHIVFGHNDLLPANFIDDGSKIWLIDFDYAGFNSPLFDLANLASNSELSEAAERSMLEQYFQQKVDEEGFKRYAAMKCASLLRETMWSMVSELHSAIEFDYVSYTAENYTRLERVYLEYRRMYR